MILVQDPRGLRDPSITIGRKLDSFMGRKATSQVVEVGLPRRSLLPFFDWLADAQKIDWCLCGIIAALPTENQSFKDPERM